jgi:hypothetical protein
VIEETATTVMMTPGLEEFTIVEPFPSAALGFGPSWNTQVSITKRSGGVVTAQFAVPSPAGSSVDVFARPTACKTGYIWPIEEGTEQTLRVNLWGTRGRFGPFTVFVSPETIGGGWMTSTGIELLGDDGVRFTFSVPAPKRAYLNILPFSLFYLRVYEPDTDDEEVVETLDVTGHPVLVQATWPVTAWTYSKSPVTIILQTPAPQAEQVYAVTRKSSPTAGRRLCFNCGGMT